MTDGTKAGREAISSAFLGIAHACPDAIVVSNASTDLVVAANAAAESLFGIPLEQLVGADRWTLVDREDPRIVEATLTREQTGRYRGRFRIIRGDGRAVEAELTTVAFLGSEGVPLIGSIIRDTASVVPIAASDDIFIAAFDMIFEVDAAGRVSRANELVSRRLGYTREEFIGRPSSDFVAIEHQEFVFNRLRQRLQGREPARSTIEFEAIGKDGERFPVSSTAVTLFENGEPSGTRVVLRDLVERRRVEDVERSYRQLFASAFNVLVSVAPDGTIEDVNESGAALAGYEREQLLGRKLIEFFDAAEIERLKRTTEDMARQRLETDPGVEMTLVSREGERIPLDVNATAVYDGARLLRFVAVARDLRPERAAGAERRRLEAEVSNAEKLRSLGILAGGIAHDFNNILMAILGGVSLARRDGADAAEIAESLELIELEARRAAELANQMLAYAGRGKYVIETLDVADIVEPTAGRARQALPDGTSLLLSTPAEPLTVEGDASQLRQVVLALLNNAAEAIREGGGGGSISLAVSHETVSGDIAGPTLADGRTLAAGDYVAIAVADTGLGMPDEVADRIFEPFYTTKTAGRGLGLAAVLGIVRAHGGGLRFETTLGEGSRFCVLLPAVSATATPRARRSETGVGAGHGVLVIDDEPAVRGVITRMLERTGYAVFEAADGQAGLDELDAHGPHVDIVVLDLSMPGLATEDTVRGLHARAPAVPLLLMSGYTEQAAADLGRIHQAEFIQKPFTFDELLGRIARMVD